MSGISWADSSLRWQTDGHGLKGTHPDGGEASPVSEDDGYIVQ